MLKSVPWKVKRTMSVHRVPRRPVFRGGEGLEPSTP